MAEGRSAEGDARHNVRVKRYFKEYPERLRAARHRSYAKQVKLYGGDPSMKYEARIKWLTSRAEKRKHNPR